MTAALATVAALCLISTVGLTVRTIYLLSKPASAILALTNQVYAIVFGAVGYAIVRFLNS